MANFCLWVPRKTYFLHKAQVLVACKQAGFTEHSLVKANFYSLPLNFEIVSLVPVFIRLY